MEQRPGQGQVLVYRGPRRPGILLARTCVKLYAPSPRYARTPPPKVRTNLSWHRVYQPHGVLKTPLWPVGPEAPLANSNAQTPTASGYLCSPAVGAPSHRSPSIFDFQLSRSQPNILSCRPGLADTAYSTLDTPDICNDALPRPGVGPVTLGLFQLPHLSLSLSLSRLGCPTRIAVTPAIAQVRRLVKT